MKSIFKFRHIFAILSILALALPLASCRDDELYPDDEFGDGEAQLEGTLVFKDFSPALKTRVAGDTLDDIKSLSVIVYNQRGQLIRNEYVTSLKKLTPPNSGRPDTLTSAQPTSLRVSFKLSEPLKYGRYKIYAVANMPAFTDDEVNSIDKLKSTQLTWKQRDATANYLPVVDDINQMFGYFTTDGQESSGDPFDAPAIAVNRENMTLTSWVRRAASKVTVSFDPSGLKDDVYIFLKSVQVKGIAKTTYLGKKSKVENSSGLEEDGEIYYFYDRKQYPAGPAGSSFDWNSIKTWPATLMNSVSSFGSDHSHTSNALFFYENMQGTGKDKAQDADKNGSIDYPNGGTSGADGYRDNKPLGTFVEVKAYYISYNQERMGRGEIVYRFMLGKNTSTDYNVERNFHYKLEMKFKGFANDIDWHISYDQETPEINAPDCYVSYLYDKRSMYPFEITGEIDPNSKITVNITKNDWYPQGAPSDVWLTTANKNVWDGFLSLRNTMKNVTVSGGQTYWNNTKKGERQYEITAGKYNTQMPRATTNPNDTSVYIIRQNKKNDLTAIIPLFTRAKSLGSGYTGNNPYVGYNRYAELEITVRLRDPSTNQFRDYKKKVTVRQEKRIENPKAIWRPYNSVAPFTVTLCELNGQPGEFINSSAQQFEEIRSIGPWYAEVRPLDNGTVPTWVVLEKSGESYEKIGADGVKRIHGKTGSKIEFKYHPKDALTDASASRGAIIRIRYHDYSCEHLIFVRQGYAPMAVTNGGVAWYSFNMLSQTKMADTPLDEGSMFRWGRWEFPINSTNNTRTGLQFGQDPATSTSVNFWIYPNNDTTGSKTWQAMSANTGVTTWAKPNITGLSTKISVAQVEDYQAISNNEVKPGGGYIQYGYGVMYCENSSKVQLAVKDAYGFYHNSRTTADGQGKGIRGIMIYNTTNHNQIFMPIGASGFGRRKAWSQHSTSTTNASAYSTITNHGVLQYANRDNPRGGSNASPLFYYLYKNPGALYWCSTSSGSKATAWDMNYNTFGFEPCKNDAYQAGATDAANKSSAIFIRCVVR